MVYDVSQGNPPAENIPAVHPELPTITSPKRVFHIPRNALVLDAKPFAHGTGGLVYKGLYMGNTIAAKQVLNVIKRAKAKDEKTVDLSEFDSEVSLLTKLSHPNIVSCYGSSVDESDGNVYQVMTMYPIDITRLWVLLFIWRGMFISHG